MTTDTTTTQELFLSVLGATLDKEATSFQVSQSFSAIGIDELDRIELIMRLEDQFSIIINDATFDEFVQLEQAIVYVDGLRTKP